MGVGGIEAAIQFQQLVDEAGMEVPVVGQPRIATGLEQPFLGGEVDPDVVAETAEDGSDQRRILALAD